MLYLLLYLRATERHCYLHYFEGVRICSTSTLLRGTATCAQAEQSLK